MCKNTTNHRRVHLQRRPLLGAALLAPLSAAATAGGGNGLCQRGQRQSPIDIDQATPRALPPLRVDWRPSPLRIVHDGHTVRVRSAAGSRLWLGDTPHRLQQFHFHLPGGDRLRGEEFPLALHFPHKSPAGQLLTLVLLCRQGPAHPALQTLLPRLPQPGQPEHSDATVQVDPSAWLPPGRGYYRYDGSLTSAPCTEGVVWLVLKSVATVSDAQLQALRAVIAPNARAPQPRNGRPVYDSGEGAGAG